jgi:hypothetical protein
LGVCALRGGEQQVKWTVDSRPNTQVGGGVKGAGYYL